MKKFFLNIILILVLAAGALQVCDLLWLRHRYLITRFGWKRWMYRLDPSKAKAFVPSATGSGMMHYRMRPLWDMVRSYGGRLITSTHDSFDASVPPEVAEEVRRRGEEILGAPFDSDLNGFACPVDSKTGNNWREVA